MFKTNRGVMVMLAASVLGTSAAAVQQKARPAALKLSLIHI